MDAKIKALLLKQKAGQPLSREEKAELFQFGMSGESPTAIDPLINEGGGARPYMAQPRDAISTEGTNYRDKAYRQMARPTIQQAPTKVDDDVWAELTADDPSSITVKDPEFTKMREALKRGK